MTLAPAGRAAPWWASLALWRGLAFAGFALAFALGVTLLAPKGERPQETIVAVLAGADLKPAIVASGDRGGRHLTVKVLAPVQIAPDRARALGAARRQGTAVARVDSRIRHRTGGPARARRDRLPESPGARRQH